MAYQIHAGVPNSRLALYDNCGHLAPGLCASKIRPDLISFLNASGVERPEMVRSEASVGIGSQLLALFHSTKTK